RVVVLDRIIHRDVKAKALWAKATHGGKNGVAGSDHIALGTSEADLCRDDVSLSVQNVQRRALANVTLFDDTTQIKLRCRDELSACGHHLLRGDVLDPSRSHSLANAIARNVDFDTRLTKRFLGLTDCRRGATTLIKRDGQVETNRSLR